GLSQRTGLTASVPIAPSTSVSWSSARATSPIARLPAAPGRLSTYIDCPSSLPISAAAERATISELPPGANGTTKRMALLGQGASAGAPHGGGGAARPAPPRRHATRRAAR